jgi:4-diphosphocytidyl-2-C-methyl-D-erythritol kinase
MVVFPNCKINIGLHITSKREDGYHNIETVMVPVAWSDALEIVKHDQKKPDESLLTGKAESGKVHFYSYGIPIPGNAEDNLCIKVYHMLEEWFELPSVDIHLIKNVPIGAGLGGGSANAAFCLRALKEYFDLSISDSEAKKLLGNIGSDCPFFWDNEPSFAYGKGDDMRRIELQLTNKWVLLVYPNIAISTAEAYSGINPKQPSIDLELLTNLPIECWNQGIVNDFEESVFPKYPSLMEVKKRFYEIGAIYSSLSGSGSAIYGIFSEEPTIPTEWQDYQFWVGRFME